MGPVGRFHEMVGSDISHDLRTRVDWSMKLLLQLRRD